MSDAWRPPGAPTDDPIGWRWWIRQEPAWTEWFERENHSNNTEVTWAGAALATSAAVGLLGWTADWVFGLSVAGITVSVIWGAFTLAGSAHFSRDPMARFRDRHMQLGDRMILDLV